MKGGNMKTLNLHESKMVTGGAENSVVINVTIYMIENYPLHKWFENFDSGKVYFS
jgi:hypothetical protein